MCFWKVVCQQMPTVLKPSPPLGKSTHRRPPWWKEAGMQTEIRTNTFTKYNESTELHS